MKPFWSTFWMIVLCVGVGAVALLPLPLISGAFLLLGLLALGMYIFARRE